MKSIFQLLMISIFCLSQFPTKTFGQNNTEEVFNIYIGAFVTAKQEDFKSLQKLGYVYAKEMDSNLVQIYLGGFDSRSAAAKALEGAKAIGFTDAYLSKRSLIDGKQVPVIQLAHRDLNQNIDWSHFLRAGNLYLLSLDQTLKITTGRFKTVEEAKAQLTQVRALGFPDAFVKMVNTLHVHKVSDFDTGGAKAAKRTIEEEPSLVLEEEAPEAAEETRTAPAAEEEELVSKGGDIPKEFDVIAFKKEKKEVDFSLPDIRAKVKRVSVMNLQRSLMSEQAYKGPVDGYYGNRTASGFEVALKNNRQIKKYQLLADNLAPAPMEAETDRLQHAINILLDRPSKAFEALEKSNEAIAKAYLAYGLFRKGGEQIKVDQLMNTAIKAAFKNKKLENAAPFDYQATYAYRDIDQLILHLSYIYGVSNKKTAVPCWLFQEHPTETTKAFEEKMRGGYSVEACERFDSWNEIKLLQTIVADINPEPVPSIQMQKAMSNLSKLATVSTPLAASKKTALEDWHTNLWNGLDSWGGKDDLNMQTIAALKLVYYQSQVRLEDFYMNKNFNKDQAKTLALASLKSIVDHQLQRYY